MVNQTALLVAVPEADPAVGEHRARLDSGAWLGVPAHVTVLYPFMPLSMLDDDVMAAVHRLFAEVGAFEARFESIGWFGRDVVYLAPSPEDRFRELTSLVVAKWPEWPPYEGAHGEPTPHLTIGDDASHAELAAAADAVAPFLPIASGVKEIQLWSGTLEQASWKYEAAFPLALPE